MKKNKIILISFILLFFIIGAVNAADSSNSDLTVDGDNDMEDLSSSDEIKEIYVNVTGDDANTGSKDSPYASIGNAISKVSSSVNNTIYLSEGTFNKQNDVNLKFTTSSNSYINNCNLTIIGAGVDKTVIDGQELCGFVSLTNMNTSLTFKNITFTNFKVTGANGAVIHMNMGNLNINNCVFKNYQSTGSAAYLLGDGNLTIVNSQFESGNGGAIYKDKGEYAHVENCTFLNIKQTSINYANAITITSNNSTIKNNKFINLTSTYTMMYGGVSLYVGGNNTNILDNTFINCSSNSRTFAPAYIDSKNISWENNTFINSTTESGKNICLGHKIDNLRVNLTSNNITITRDDFINNLNISVNAYDDMDNSVILTGNVNFDLINNGKIYSFTSKLSAGDFTISFDSLIEDGNYDVNITLMGYGLTLSSLAIVDFNSTPFDIWVSPVGDDNNGGSKESPFKTIQHAIDTGFENSLIVNVHLVEGIHSGVGNVALNIAKKGIINIIGENNNVTIDGQSSNKFLVLVGVAVITLKNLTLTNFRGSGGAVLESSDGTLNIENCIFTNYNSTNNRAAIYLSKKNKSKLTVINSQFVNGIGGAIHTAAAISLYLNNNTFSNISKSSGNGLAILTVSPNVTIINNKFINLTAPNSNFQDAAIHIDEDGSIIVNNTFINCNSPSSTYSIVYLKSCEWKNNSFINSTNTIGESIRFIGLIDSLKAWINMTELIIHNNEIKNGISASIKALDDSNNSVSISSASAIFTKNNSSYTFYFQKSNNIFNLAFSTILENGDYNVSISVGGGNEKLIIPAKVQIDNDPIDFWISPDGNDANDGSQNNPFKTIQHAIDIGFNENTFTVNIHLLEGTYIGEDNINLTIANKGNLNITGVYNKSIIDGENSNWFAHIGSTTRVNFINLTFANGNSKTDLLSGQTLKLKDCIITNCTGNAIINSVSNIDGLSYINNTGYIYCQFSGYINNSYFANNLLNTNGFYAYGLINISGINLENSIFINNTYNNDQNSGSIIYSSSIFSKNNYFDGNYAGDGIFHGSTSSRNGNYFENNTFINNVGVTSGVFYVDGSSSWGSPNFIECKFINNTASNGPAIASLVIGNFTNCSFINNSGEINGVFKLQLVKSDGGIIEFNNVIFNNFGCDIYLDSSNKNSYPSSERDKMYFPIHLNISFNDINVTKLYDTLSANITGPYGSIIGGESLNFKLAGESIGSANIVNGVALLNYASFNEGNYSLSGYIQYVNNATVNDAVVHVTSEGVLTSVEYWVSVNGGDENGNGSEELPFKSIYHAINKASENCRNITIHLMDELYVGDLYTGLELSSANNLTIVGCGIDKTIIDGNGSNYFARITSGNRNVIISNLTIQNVVTTGQFNYNSILIDSSANLYLKNIKFANCSAIRNNGNLYIDNSEFTLNKGMIYGGYIIIDNSIFSYSTGSIEGNYIVINNTIIRDIIAESQFILIDGDFCNIMNTMISNDCNNASLKEWGIGEEKVINPAVAICPANINLDNVTILNNFIGEVTDYNAGYGAGTQLSLFGYTYIGSQHITAKNSKFHNFKYLWCVNGNEMIFNLDSCVFDSIFMIAQSQTVGLNSRFNISNSIFINSTPAIDRLGRSDRADPVCYFENNYWGNNSKIVVEYVNPGDATSFEPESWIIITSENGKYKLQVTDGENISDYDGSLPAKISYIEYDGVVVPVLNIEGNGYLLGIGDDNIILTDSVIENIAPKAETNETVIANNLTTVYGDGNNQFIVNYTYWWSDAIANADVSIVIGNETYNSTTDENGSAVFTFDLKPGIYDVSIVNPLTNQYLVRSIEVDTNVSAFASDLVVVLGDGNQFVANFTDKIANPLINTNISLTIGNVTVNGVTDVNGSARFDINVKPGIYAVNIANPVTGYSIERTLEVYTNNTIIASDISLFYGAGSQFSAIFTDNLTNPLANVNVSFTVADTTINTTTDENGSAKFTVDLTPGTYAVKMSNPLDNHTAVNKIVVNKLTTKITAPSVSSVYNIAKNLVITLKDQNNRVLSGASVIVKINGKTSTLKTDKNGQIKIATTLLPAKSHTVNINFKGNELYKNSVITTKVNIVKASAKLTASKKSYKAKVKTKKYSITLKDNKNKALSKTKVTLKVNGKTYKATTNSKGVATFKITKLNKKGSFNAKVSFAGNSNFKALSNLVKISVK